MSGSSDSEDYSSRVLSKNKKNDENFMSCKNNFIKDFQNRSHIPNVDQKSFSEANESFVNNTEKRKREHLDESDNLNASETNKKKKVHHSNDGDLVTNDFVTVREDLKKKSKKKNHTIAANKLEVSIHNSENEDERSEGKKKKHKKKKFLSVPDGINSLEAESVENEEEQAETSKKRKKSKKRSKIESENIVDQPLSKKDSIITSTQVDRSNLPAEDLNESKQSLLDFEQKNLSIQNIESEHNEDELDIEDLIEEAKLHLKSPSSKQNKKRSKKPSENLIKADKLKKDDDPAAILKTFEKSNSSLKKVNFENDSLHNLKANHPCFIFKVPVDLDPNELVGKDISFHKKDKIKIGASEYVTSPRKSDVNLIVFENSNQHLSFEVSRIVTMKSTPKEEVFSARENEIINDLISKNIKPASSNENKNQVRLEKSPTKNNVDQLDGFLKNGVKFLKDGAKFLEDLKSVNFKLKNEKLIVDLDKQTNIVLQKQLEFMQEQNTSTAKYKKTKKELEEETRELLQKRVNITKSKKGGDEELSDYF